MQILAGGITISDIDHDALMDIIDDADLWLQAALIGKIAHSKKRLDREWRSILDADPAVLSLPASVDERVALIVTRPDYKNRAARDAIEAAR